MRQSLGDSINYRDASGAWQPIDNTLIAAQPALADAGFAYQNAANAYTVAFAGASGGPALERITYHGITLDLAPLNAQVASTSPSNAAQIPTTATLAAQPAVAAVSGNAVTYPRLFPATNIAYSVDNDAVKESLILRDASAPSSFTFALRVSGAQASPRPNGRIAFVDSTGAIQLQLAAPVAVDARGAATLVSTTISTVAGVIRLSIAIPTTWLSDRTRAWPVTLDPTVNLPFSQYAVVNSQNRGYLFPYILCTPGYQPPCPNNQNAYGTDEIGNIYDATDYPSSPTSVSRAMMQFDLSVLPPHVTLLRALLRSVVLDTAPLNFGGKQAADQTVNASVYPLTASWTVSATWQTRDGTTPWSVSGGDYDPNSGVTTSVDYSRGTYGDTLAVWNVTSLVQQWYLGQRPNNGLILRMVDESIYAPRELDFHTWNNGGENQGCIYCPPSGASGLQVVYSYIPWQGGAAPGGERAFDPHAALKSDRALITFPQGDGQQMGVNIANGDLEIMRNDVTIPSLGLPNVVQRTFHSTASISQTTALGHQWQLSVGGDTALFPQPVGDAIYVDPTGQGYDIPEAITSAVSAVLTDTVTQGSWNGVYGHDGYVLNGWNNGSDVTALPGYAAGYTRAQGGAAVWQTNTTDTRALSGPPGQTQRNATALSASSAPTQTQQVVMFNARTLITASVYLLNWGASPTSAGEIVQVQDAVGSHSYHAASFNNGLWVSFTNLHVGPTQPLTVTIVGDAGSSALSSALMFDGGVSDSYARATALAADLTQNADGTYALTFNNGLTELFSASGQYTGAKDRHGNAEQFGYGTGGCGPGTISVITDTVGRVTAFSCDSTGTLVTAIVDADHRAVQYGYDPATDNLTSFTDRAGGVTLYQYNAAGLPVTITDPISNQTVITYDAALRVSAVRDGAGSVTTFSYGVTGTNTTTVTNPLGASTVYTFDPATGEILSVTDPNGHTTRSYYDANALLIETRDPLGHYTANTTTSSSDQTGSTNPLGDGVSTAYNALHEPTSVVDTQGRTTLTQYNAVGDPVTVTDPLSYTTVYTTASNGLRTAMSDGDGHTTQYGYDAFGDTVAVTDALGRVSTMTYDTNISRLASVTDPKHQTTRFTYDNEDRTTQTTYQDGSTVTNYLDADGNVTETVDSAGTTLFRYDGDNRLVQQTYPDGTVVQYSYDAAGHMQSKSEPGLPLTSYSYDPAGNLITVTNSLWGPIVYHYDAANRLTSLGYPNGVTTTYGEDDDNRLTALTQTITSTVIFSDTFSYAKPGGGTWGLRSGEATNEKGKIVNWSYYYDADARLIGANEITTTQSITNAGIITTVAGTGTAGYNGDNIAATTAQLNGPNAVAVDKAGDVFIADKANNRVREIIKRTGVITTVAGTGTAGYNGDNIVATSAQLNGPFGLALDAAGNLYIADTGNQRVREVIASTGVITTVAGTGHYGYSGDGGPATAAQLYNPAGLAFDAAGDLYIVEYGNQVVRKVAAGTGIISTVAGVGPATRGYNGDGIPATQAYLAVPSGIAVDNSGDLFIADQLNNRVREVLASTGIITTVAGIGTAGYSGDGGAATQAKLNWPQSVAVDAAGNLYISDSANARVRKVDATSGAISTIAGTGTGGYNGDGIAATQANVSPAGIALDVAGNLYIADANRVREVYAAAVPAPTFVYGYDAVGNLTNNNGTAQAYDAANQITAAGAVTYTYDTDGNQTATSKSTHPAWAYNAQNRTQAYSDTATSDTFLSWASGWRAKKTTVQGGTTTSGVFDGDMYRQSSPVSTTIYYERDPNGRLLVLTDGSKVYYYGLDGHGSVNNVTDGKGNVLDRYHYDPYGNATYRSENASLANPWQYAGGYYDAESGLYLLGVRYYDPKLGRFLQQDPLGTGTSSQYAYASSDPCNNSDPSGMLTCYRRINKDTALQQSTDIGHDANMTSHDAAESFAAAGAAAIIGGPAAPVAVAIYTAIGTAQAFRASDEGELAGWMSTYAGEGEYVSYPAYNEMPPGVQGPPGPVHCAPGDQTYYSNGILMPSNDQSVYWSMYQMPGEP